MGFLTGSRVRYDVDGRGEIDYHASGSRPSHTTSWLSRAARWVFRPSTLVPPWGADTYDGYDIYAGNWPVTPDVPSCPIGVHKASEGFGTYDARFPEWSSVIAPRHRYRGAYHVIWPWRAGKADNYIEQQAQAFLDYTSRTVNWSQPGWFVQIDNEQFSGMPRIANVSEVRRFADYLIDRIGPKVSHYCNPVTDPELFFAPELADLAKWEAQYNRNESRSPTVIRQWGGWPIAGIWNGRAADANFIEKPAQLDTVAGYADGPIPAPAPAPAPPPPTFGDDDMPLYRISYGDIPRLDGDGAIYELIGGCRRHVPADEWGGVIKGVAQNRDGSWPDHESWQPRAALGDGWVLAMMADYTPPSPIAPVAPAPVSGPVAKAVRITSVPGDAPILY